MRQYQTDWLKIIVHSICGVILGTGIGISFWIFVLDTASTQTAIYSIGGGALVFGVLAGVYLDDFWEFVKENGIWPW